MLSYERILVPIDFTEISTAALAKAAHHSEASGSRLYVAHIAAPTPVLSQVTRDSVQQEILQKIDQMLDDAEVGYSEKIVEFGDTVPTLLDIILKHKIDLVVMGTHHFNSMDEHNSVTKAMGENIECDILILHK